MNGEIVAAGVSISSAESYADCLTYDGGHAEHWDRWQEAGIGWLRANRLPEAIAATEYDAHPRGRIVFDQRLDRFILYADRRLHTADRLAVIKQQFNLPTARTTVRSDQHYR